MTDPEIIRDAIAYLGRAGWCDQGRNALDALTRMESRLESWENGCICTDKTRAKNNEVHAMRGALRETVNEQIRTIETKDIHIQELQKMVDHFRDALIKSQDGTRLALQERDAIQGTANEQINEINELAHANCELNDLIQRIKSICDNGARAEETVRLGVLIAIRDYRNHLALMG